MKRQAAYNGEIGANGKAYVKGQFIAEQAECHTTATKGKSSGKQEIAPYVWEVPEDSTQRSIYSFISAFVNFHTGARLYEAAAFSNIPAEQLDSLADRYEAGERWFYPDHEIYS